MKSKLILAMMLVLIAAACGGRDGARNAAQQNYETVEEGSASGVASTIHGPGETLPPNTGTNADTTTNFALNPNDLPPPQAQPIAGAAYPPPQDLPPMTSASASPQPVPEHPPASPQQTPAPQPEPERSQPQPAEPEALTTNTDTNATTPPTNTAPPPEKPANEEPPPPPADNTIGEHG